MHFPRNRREQADIDRSKLIAAIAWRAAIAAPVAIVIYAIWSVYL